MSIKLYNGYILEGRNAFDFVQELKEKFTPTAVKLSVQELVDFTTDMIDTRKSDKDIDTSLRMFRVAERSWLEKRHGYGYNDYDYDPLRFSVAFSRIDDKTYLMYPTGRYEDYHEVLVSLDGVREYGYWDNAEKPDNVSEEEWNLREKHWRNAMKKSGNNFENLLHYRLQLGFTKVSVDPFYVASHAEFHGELADCDYIVPLERRYRNIARQNILDALIEKYESKGEKFDYMKALDFSRKIDTYIRKNPIDTGGKSLAEITIQDILHSYPDEIMRKNPIDVVSAPYIAEAVEFIVESAEED